MKTNAYEPKKTKFTLYYRGQRYWVLTDRLCDKLEVLKWINLIKKSLENK